MESNYPSVLRNDYLSTPNIDENSPGKPANCDFQCPQSNDQSMQKFLWIKVLDCLKKNPGLQTIFKKNLNALSVSKEMLYKFKHFHPAISQYVDSFGGQNCLRAISVLEDLISVKKNPYKFMYQHLTLQKAIDMLVKESTYLHRNMSKIEFNTNRKFLQVTGNWIDCLFYIHKVPGDAREELKLQILISISLENNMNYEFTASDCKSELSFA
jgi:hypothetical protein